MITKTLLERLDENEPIFFDGGFGSQLINRGIEIPNTAIANLSHPEDVTSIHEEYIGSGARIIGANTFVAGDMHLRLAGVAESEFEEIVKKGVDHAKEAVRRSGNEVYIGGSIGPVPGVLEIEGGEISIEAAQQSYRRQVEILAEEGVDILILETYFSAVDAVLAVGEASECGIPISLALTMRYTPPTKRQRKGRSRRTQDTPAGENLYRTMWGHSYGDLLDMLINSDRIGNVNLLGINCGSTDSEFPEHSGMPYAINAITQLQKAMTDRDVKKHMIAYPNAGIPSLDSNGHSHYNQTPREMAAHIPSLLDAGAKVIGGCCGSDPKHITAMVEASRTYQK